MTWTILTNNSIHWHITSKTVSSYLVQMEIISSSMSILRNRAIIGSYVVEVRGFSDRFVMIRCNDVTMHDSDRIHEMLKPVIWLWLP